MYPDKEDKNDLKYTDYVIKNHTNKKRRGVISKTNK